MTYEPKERKILDQVVAALHGHYGERMGRFAPEVRITSLDVRGGNAELGIASLDVRGGNAELGITSLDVRGGNAELGIASLDVREGNTELGITSLDVWGSNTELGIASLGIFIQPARSRMSKKSHLSPAAYCDCAILNTFITAGLTPRSASTALFPTN